VPDLADRLRSFLDEHARFAPVLRFTLLSKQTPVGAEERVFRVERWCYLGRIDGWLDLHRWKPIEDLARETVPTLGTEDFFELH
jgi:hypothetical protein